MFFSPISCSIIKARPDKFQLSVHYKTSTQNIVTGSGKIPFDAEPNENTHTIRINGTSYFFKNNKYRKRICHFLHCTPKLTKIVEKVLTTINTETDLCQFVQFTLCFNQWKKHIAPQLKEREILNSQSYATAKNFKTFINHYLNRFNYLHPDLLHYMENYRDKKLLPLINKIRVRNLTINAVAAKGKAFTTAVKAMIHLENQQKFLIPDKRHNHIVLMPDENCVFKQAISSSREEESLIEALFTLSMENGVVYGMNFHRLGSNRHGHFNLTPEEYQRAFPVCACTPLFLDKIVRMLANERERELWNKIAAGYGRQDEITRNYKYHSGLTYHVYHGENRLNLNFVTFKRYLNEGKFAADTFIRTSQSNHVQRMDHFLMSELVVCALQYEESLRVHQRTLFVPCIPNAEFLKMYQQMEATKWEYLDKDIWLPATFKELQSLWITGDIDSGTKVCREGAIESFAIGGEDRKLYECLNVNWKLFFPETKYEYQDQLLSYLNPTAKPYIHHMVLFSELAYQDPCFLQIANRLDDDSILKTLLTAEFQFLDLHSNNLGATLNPTGKYEEYVDWDFQTDFATCNFKDFVKDYLDGDISCVDTISVRKTIEQNFRQLDQKEVADLLNCVESTWSLQLFDTDYSLGESNVIHTFCMDYKKPMQKIGHLIPLRSDLLATQWRDRPIKPAIIRKWMDPERIKRVRNWVNRRDSPIKKLIPAHLLSGLEAKIDEHFNSPEYSLSKAHSADHLDSTVKDIIHQCAIDLSDSEKHETLWIFLETVLRKAAKGYFNDLSIDRAKRWRIAKHLLPRLTYFQRHALFERQERALNYLKSYAEIETITEDSQKIVFIEKMINASYTPFTLIQSLSFQEKLDEIKCFPDSKHLDNFFQYLKNKLTPTYFNICKSMYPLLADEYFLAEHFYPNSIIAGKKIGEYTTPIEDLIEKGKIDQNEDIRRTALYLENEITEADKEFKAYFGNFETKNKVEENVS